MMKVFLHHGGKLSWVSGNYVGGEVVLTRNFDPYYLSVTHLWTFIKNDLKYHEAVELQCYFDGKPFEKGINSLENDTDVYKVISRITREGHDALRIFVEHKPSVADVVPPEPMQFTFGGEGKAQQNVADGDCEGEGERVHINEGERVHINEGEEDNADDEADFEGLDNAGVAREMSDFEESDDEIPELFGYPSEVRAAVEKGRVKAQGKRPAVEQKKVQVEASVQKRKNVMEWFGTGSRCGSDVEDPHVEGDGSNTEVFESMSEGGGDDSDACKKRKCKEF